MAIGIDSADDFAGNLLGIKHYGIMKVACQQVSIDESRTDVGEADIQLACIGLLLKSLEIDVLHGLGGGIGRSGS